MRVTPNWHPRFSPSPLLYLHVFPRNEQDRALQRTEHSTQAHCKHTKSPRVVATHQHITPRNTAWDCATHTCSTYITRSPHAPNPTCKHAHNTSHLRSHHKSLLVQYPYQFLEHHLFLTCYEYFVHVLSLSFNLRLALSPTKELNYFSESDRS